MCAAITCSRPPPHPTPLADMAHTPLIPHYLSVALSLSVCLCIFLLYLYLCFSALLHSKAAIRLLSEMLESSDISQSLDDAREELERLFLFSVSWALGGLLEPDERSKFDHYLRQLCPNNMPSLGGATAAAAAAGASDGDSVSGTYRNILCSPTRYVDNGEGAKYTRGCEPLARARRGFSEKLTPALLSGVEIIGPEQTKHPPLPCLVIFRHSRPLTHPSKEQIAPPVNFFILSSVFPGRCFCILW